LGFDILIDEELTPHLLEVNHMPSFSTDSTLDFEIKSQLLMNTFQLVNMTVKERTNYHTQTTMESQYRLYGDLFDDKNRSTQQDKNFQKAKYSEQRYWRKYNINEAKSLGKFDLVYPTNIYENQPTRGNQQIYDDLLLLAECLFSSTTGNRKIQGIGIVEHLRTLWQLRSKSEAIATERRRSSTKTKQLNGLSSFSPYHQDYCGSSSVDEEQEEYDDPNYDDDVEEEEEEDRPQDYIKRYEDVLMANRMVLQKTWSLEIDGTDNELSSENSSSPPSQTNLIISPKRPNTGRKSDHLTNTLGGRVLKQSPPRQLTSLSFSIESTTKFEISPSKDSKFSNLQSIDSIHELKMYSSPNNRISPKSSPRKNQHAEVPVSELKQSFDVNYSFPSRTRSSFSSNSQQTNEIADYFPGMKTDISSSFQAKYSAYRQEYMNHYYKAAAKIQQSSNLYNS
jgi:hypothetical protein